MEKNLYLYIKIIADKLYGYTVVFGLICTMYLSELAPMIFDTVLTHLGSEASK